MRSMPSPLISVALVGFVSLFMVACGPIPIDSSTINPSDLDISSDDEDNSDHDSSSYDDPSTAPMPDPNPYVRIVSPGHGDTVDNPVTFVVEALDVASLQLQADGWPMASWVPSAFSTTQTYSFSGTGVERVVELIGEDSDGNPLVVDSITITPEDSTSPGAETSSGSVLSVPYFYQYDNANEPSSTCGITSAAMLVNYWNPNSATPDSFYSRYGKPQGQSPGGLAQLYAWEGLYSTHTYGASRNDIRAHINAGRPVVVHGNWTSAGHVAVIIGHDSTGWIANDPAGDWQVCYGCGLGNSVHYAYGGGWDDALSYDGDIWLSVASSTAF